MSFSLVTLRVVGSSLPPRPEVGAVGREAAALARIGRKRAHGVAKLETDYLRFSGEMSFKVPFAAMREVRAEAGTLRFRCDEGAVALELGASAARWADVILQPKSVVQKFGIKPTARVCLLGALEGSFIEDLQGSLERRPLTALRGSFDAIVWRIDEPEQFARLGSVIAHLDRAGALWFITPKGRSSAVPERMLREAFLGAGLVDIKISAFSQTHTATKCVIPIKDR